MSALGQKPPRRLTATVSALPPKADTNRCGWHVRYGPKADVTHPLSWRIMSGIDLTVLRTDARAAIYDQAKIASQFDGVSQCRECGRDRAGGSAVAGLKADRVIISYTALRGFIERTAHAAALAEALAPIKLAPIDVPLRRCWS